MGVFWNGGFEMMFFLVFFLILGCFVFVIIRGLAQWNKNNHSPRLTVEATVAAKRIRVTPHTNNIGNGAMSTSYYVTFQVESGDRMEFSVNGREYGMLAERDYGKLTFQGTRYLGFERIS